jgi:hypothetical protein
MYISLSEEVKVIVLLLLICCLSTLESEEEVILLCLWFIFYWVYTGINTLSNKNSLCLSRITFELRLNKAECVILIL